MKPLFVICFFLLFAMLSACAGGSEESGFSVFERKALLFPTYKGNPIYKANDPNAKLHYRLLPNELQFEKVMEGKEISLNSLIVMPDIQDGGFLTIEFNRADLKEFFIREFFYGEDDKVANGHPFVREGVEPTLTDQRFILNIHPGIAFHLRNGMESNLYYQTFTDENVIGKITKVEGNVYYSSDHEYIKIVFSDLYVFVSNSMDITSIDPTYVKQRPDGSYVITAPLDAYEMPVRYPPRILEGP